MQKEPAVVTAKVIRPDLLLVVDDLSADEGYRVTLRLRGRDSCALWIEEGSDGAQDYTRKYTSCDNKAWVDSWIEKFSDTRSTVSWVSKSADFDKLYAEASYEFDRKYAEAPDEAEEYSMYFVLEQGEERLRPESAADLRIVREVADALWLDAGQRMSEWPLSER